MLWRGSSLGQTTNYANTPCVLNKNLECPENGWTNSTFRRKIQVMRAHAVRSGCVGERTGVEEQRARNGPWGRGPVSCDIVVAAGPGPVSYTHLRAHETVLDLVCRLLLEKKKRI